MFDSSPHVFITLVDPIDLPSLTATAIKLTDQVSYMHADVRLQANN